MLPFQLSICGLNELAEFMHSDVSHAISILDPDWPDPHELTHLPAQNRLILRFDDVTFAQPSHSHPGSNDIEKLIMWGRSLTEFGAQHLLVHCHAGVSRSTAAAAILMVANNPGQEARAFEDVNSIRPKNWPNSMMINLADSELGCEGAFTNALRVHHARVAERDPNLAQLIKLHGRAHEIPEGI